MIRTHEAGTLRAAHAGEHVVLAGWVARRRDHGGVVFIDLRDASGVVQVVWRGEEAGRMTLRAEFCVPGDRRRCGPPGRQREPRAAHRRDRGGGDRASRCSSEADPLPFPIEGAPSVSEDVRLKYRYLDIRRADTGRAPARPVRGHAYLLIRRDARPRLRRTWRRPT